MWDKGLVSFFYMWKSGYLVITMAVVEKTVVSPLNFFFFGHPYWKSIDCKYECLFLDSPLYLIDLYVLPYASITLSWSLNFVLKCWNWEVLVLLLCSSISRSFWLFCTPWTSIWIVGWACQFLQRASQDFTRDCVESLGQAWEYCHLNVKPSDL